METVTVLSCYSLAKIWRQCPVRTKERTRKKWKVESGQFVRVRVTPSNWFVGKRAVFSRQLNQHLSNIFSIIKLSWLIDGISFRTAYLINWQLCINSVDAGWLGRCFIWMHGTRQYPLWEVVSFVFVDKLTHREVTHKTQQFNLWTHSSCRMSQNYTIRNRSQCVTGSQSDCR